MSYGVIFDCDGVLVDSEALSIDAWLAALATRGLIFTQDDFSPLVGKSVAQSFVHLDMRRAFKDIAEAGAAYEAAYRDIARGRLQRFSGVLEMLQVLRAQRVPVALASSGTPAKIEFSLSETGLSDYFPIIANGTEVSRGKPAPDLFLLAAQRLGLPPERCVVVEDSLLGVEAGRSAGMLTVGFPSSHSAPALLAAGAHEVIEHIAALLPLLAMRFGPRSSE